MAKVIEPLRQDQKMCAYLDEDNVKRVGIVFWHGLGDCVQFIHIYEWLKKNYPAIHFDIMLQNHLDQQVIFPDAVMMPDLKDLESYDYDYIFLVHFPVEIDGVTKAELCCDLEIGCPKIWEYGEIPNYERNKYESKPRSGLIGLHYQNTALPDVFNPSSEVAEKIWKEVLESGFIPIELDFQHAYHNPVNEQFGFIDCSVRSVKPKITTLLDLISVCEGVIAVPSGPLHCSLAMIPKRVLYMEKHVPVKRFTYWDVPSINLKEYNDGDTSKWLNTLI